MTGVLPEPRTIENIVRLFSENRFLNTQKEWLIKGLKVEKYVHILNNDGVIKTSSSSFDKLNMYFLYRCLNQVNEACNKLWGTMELYNQLAKGPPIYSGFNPGYLSSTTVPTLHYANMSALVSLITLFGVCSWVEKGQKNWFYNLVRTSNGLIIKERTKHLVDTFGTAKVGWHQQVIQMYEGFCNHGISLPDINIIETKRLLSERNRVQYDILTQTTMKGMYGNGYFSFLPAVIKNIGVAINNLSEVVNPLPNGADKRFSSLEGTVPELLASYSANNI